MQLKYFYFTYLHKMVQTSYLISRKADYISQTTDYFSEICDLISQKTRIVFLYIQNPHWAYLFHVTEK